MKQWQAVFAAAVVAVGVSVANGQTGGQRLTDQELRLLYSKADLIVQFEVASSRTTTLDPKLVWEVTGPVLAVLKGDLGPGAISVHVASIVRAFDRPGSDLRGKQYVAGLEPLSAAGRRHYKLVADRAFAAEGPDAVALRHLAEKDAAGNRPGLELEVRPMQPVFLPRGPKVIAVRLANNTDDTVTYLEAPIIERDGKLYLPGGGSLWVRDQGGNVVPDTGDVHSGEAPQPPGARPEPSVIFSKTSFTKTIDLSKYYDLDPGRYTVHVSLASPGQGGRVSAEPVPIQVGAVNLAPPPEPTGPVARTTPASAEPALPGTGFYSPGEARSGLAAMLRPTKPSFELGEPVTVEFRLVNASDRTIAVDVRLERTLTFEVTPVGESPPPRSLRNTILWPADEPGLPETRAHLRGLAFWGRLVDVNWYHGKGEKDLPRPGEIEAGKDFTYERFGRMLFDFHEPGVYRIQARYEVQRPKPPRVPAPAAEVPPAATEKAVEGPTGPKTPEPSTRLPLDMRWWVGEVESNPVLVRITPPTGRRRGW